MTTTDRHVPACRCIWCASDPDKVPAHGTVARYQDRLCRCSSCRRANSTRHRVYVEGYQAASRQAPAHGEPWTPEEDAVLIELGAIAASKVLPRTYFACERRLARLKRSM